MRKCSVRLTGSKATQKPALVFNDEFVCTGSFDPAKPGVVGPAPGSLDNRPTQQGKGKGKQSKAAAASSVVAAEGEAEEDSGLSLATMDIFAGCGGLSEGMHQVQSLSPASHEGV